MVMLLNTLVVMVAMPLHHRTIIITRRPVKIPAGANHITITAGDFFGSDSISDQDLRKLYNRARAVIVPGVTSVSAASAAVSTPLVQGDQVLTILPGTLPAEELPEAIAGAEVLFAYDFFSTAIPDAWPAADALEWIHVASTGVDAILSPEVRDSDVVLTNSRGVFDASIAEYVLAQVLAFAKDLPQSTRLQQAHRWVHRESERVAGTRALVVGTGQIGRAIARLLRAVGVEVSGSGRRARDDDPDFGTVTAQEDLHHALAAADWVVCIAPLTDATRGMFDAAAFRAMPDHARFINVGRGESVVTDDLVDALRSGTIAGAALDVFDTEPPDPADPIIGHPNVLATPHVAYLSDATTRGYIVAQAQNVVQWMQTGTPVLTVNDPVVPVS